MGQMTDVLVLCCGAAAPTGLLVCSSPPAHPSCVLPCTSPSTSSRSTCYGHTGKDGTGAWCMQQQLPWTNCCRRPSMVRYHRRRCQGPLVAWAEGLMGSGVDGHGMKNTAAAVRMHRHTGTALCAKAHTATLPKQCVDRWVRVERQRKCIRHFNVPTQHVRLCVCTLLSGPLLTYGLLVRKLMKELDGS